MSARPTRPERASAETLVEEPGAYAEAIEAGEEIGRYIVQRRLGAGAMGVVYAAFDPELDRNVAIKVLQGAEPSTSQSGRRMLREARAMARVSHPNVVTVHDVGEDDGRIFIAMELIDGQTLGAWLQERRTWRQVLDVLLAAGRGLAAVHDAGLVHRDFKPANVMVGHDGRVVVMDFGIARDYAEGAVVLAREQSTEELAVDLTRSGVLLGTPAYMSPEQFRTSQADARSDQFAFCVVAYEAFFGLRPFAGTTAASVFLAIMKGELATPRSPRAVPSWLERAIVTGLAAEPHDRHPTMHALLDLLERERRRRSKPLVWLAALAPCALGAAFMLGGDTPCPDAHAQLEGVWDRARARAVSTAIGGGTSTAATETVERVTNRLDRYAAEWVVMRDENCRATNIEGTQSEVAGDLRGACLDRRLEAMRQAVDVLEGMEAGGRNAVTIVAGLEPLAPCRDAEALARGVAAPTDPATAREVDDARDRLARVRALVRAGRFEEAATLAEELEAIARRIDYAPLVAEALLERGTVAFESGRGDLGEAALSQAYFLAHELHHDAVAARAASRSSYVVGYRLARHEEGRKWGEHALSAALRAGDRVAEAEAHHHLGALAGAVADMQGAHDHYAKSIALRRELLEPDHPDLGRSLNALGNVHMMRAEYDDALRQYRASLQLRERAFGPNHPEVAGALNNLSLVLRRQGDHAGAEQALRRAIAIYVDAFGESHVDVAQARNNLGTVLRHAGDLEGAVREHERSLAIREAEQGRDHPDVGDALVGLGRALSDLGRHAEAVELHARALALYEAGFGPSHTSVGTACLGLGIAQARLGRHDEAAVALERAASIFGRAPEGTEYAETLAELAKIGRR